METRMMVSLDERDAQALAGQQRRHGRARRAAAHDEDVAGREICWMIDETAPETVQSSMREI